MVSWIPRFCWWRFSPRPVRCDDEADEDEAEEDEEDEEDEDEENWDVAESNVPILQQVPWPKQKSLISWKQDFLSSCKGSFSDLL